MKSGRKILLYIFYASLFQNEVKPWCGVSGFKTFDVVTERRILAQYCPCGQVGFQVAWCSIMVFLSG